MDLDTAYRRIHVNARITSTCIAIVYNLLLLCLCLTFRMTPVPADYTTVIESSIDLENDICRDKSWDATEIHSPHRQLPDEEEYHPVQDPLFQADQPTVGIKAKKTSMDVLIDDIVTITIDDPNWVECAKNVALWVIHTIFRLLQSSEPPKQN